MRGAPAGVFLRVGVHDNTLICAVYVNMWSTMNLQLRDHREIAYVTLRCVVRDEGRGQILSIPLFFTYATTLFGVLFGQQDLLASRFPEFFAEFYSEFFVV